MHPQQLAGTKVPVETKARVNEGLGIPVLSRKATAFTASLGVGTSDIAEDTADAEVSSYQKNLFFREHTDTLSPALTRSQSQPQAKRCNQTSPQYGHKADALFMRRVKITLPAPPPGMPGADRRHTGHHR